MGAVTLRRAGHRPAAGGRPGARRRRRACCCSPIPGWPGTPASPCRSWRPPPIVLLAPGWSRRLRERGWPPVLADARGGERRGRPGHRADRRRPVRHGQPGLAAGQPARRSRRRPGHRARPARRARRRARAARAATPWSGSPAGRSAGWCWSPSSAAAVPDAATGWPAGTVGRGRCSTVLLLVGGWALWRVPRLRPLALAAVVGLRRASAGRSGRRCAGWPPGGHGRRRLRRRPGRRAGAAGRARGRRCSSTPAPTSRRSTGAWTGWASTPCRWSCCPTWTPTTPAAWPARWPAGTSAWSPPRRCHRPTTGSAPSTGWSRRAGATRAVLVPGRPAHRRRRRRRGAGARPGAGHGVGGAQRPVDGRPADRARGRGSCSPATSAPRRRPGSSPAASTCGPTC